MREKCSDLTQDSLKHLNLLATGTTTKLHFFLVSIKVPHSLASFVISSCLLLVPLPSQPPYVLLCHNYKHYFFFSCSSNYLPLSVHCNFICHVNRLHVLRTTSINIIGSNYSFVPSCSVFSLL